MCTSKTNDTDNHLISTYFSQDDIKGINLARDMIYEKKVIEHITNTKNVGAATILGHFYFRISSGELAQIVEMLVLWGNPDSSFETFLNYRNKNNIMKARYFLKLYFQQMYERVKNFTPSDIKYSSILPRPTFCVCS